MNLKPLLLFHYKLIPLSLFLSVCITLLVGSWNSFGQIATLIGVSTHYVQYEYRKPEEYAFYFNLGWSRKRLWLSTILFYLVIVLLNVLVWIIYYR
ncbi:hypothetical protein [Nonlabens tegetincola]|uniref:hypothetical protein n=1 Tax=Nonlabens tegetincola TaxID=323273 RepID=UPI001268097F|nr:hypothetical protein [Nonlabens tegetincola]